MMKPESTKKNVTPAAPSCIGSTWWICRNNSDFWNG
ncbi:Uncharacterised protein [Mycobacteroides abscessus subsp. abscessus]|nr:Uncharacterised protein [Mycobacteroides abscessus subsp. abscessus]